MKYGIVWGRTNGFSKGQWIALKKDFGKPLKEASAESRLAYYSAINDDYNYPVPDENIMFFALCAEAFTNRNIISKQAELPQSDDSGKGFGIEDYLSHLYKNATDSQRQRDVVALCGEKNVGNKRFIKRLANIMMQMKRDKSISVPMFNSASLEKDLLAWNLPDAPVQRRWGKVIARVKTEKENDDE